MALLILMKCMSLKQGLQLLTLHFVVSTKRKEEVLVDLTGSTSLASFRKKLKNLFCININYSTVKYKLVWSIQLNTPYFVSFASLS